MIMTT